MVNSTDHERFGPLVEDYRDYFDLTPLFEDTILSITPSILILSIGLARVAYLCIQPKQLLGRSLKYSKLGALLCYTSLQITILVLWNIEPLHVAKTTTAAASLVLANSFVLCVLSYLEHDRNIRPSSILIFYLFFSTAFDILRVRTLWHLSASSRLAALSTASVIIKGIVLVLEAYEKRRYLPKHFQDRRPEETSSILNRGIFYWLNSLLWRGARSFLAPNDIYELDYSLSSTRLSKPFLDSWRIAKDRKPENSMIKSLLKTLKWQMLAAVFPRVVFTGLTVSLPLLLEQLLLYLAAPEPKATGVGHSLIAAYALVYFGIAVSNGFYWHAQFRFLTMLRGCLVSAMNRQVVKLDLQAVGDPKNALTLMSTDIEQITMGLQNIHEFWGNSIQVAISVYLLVNRVGVAAVVPMTLACVSAAITAWSCKVSGHRQTQWMEAVEKRISLVSSMLPSMKEVKMKGLSKILQSTIEKYRVKELQFARRVRQVVMVVIGCAHAPEILSPTLTFLIFFLRAKQAGQQFDAPRAFTSLSLIVATTQPLNQTFQSLPQAVMALTSLRRIEKFLCADEQRDFRDVEHRSDERQDSTHVPTSFMEGPTAIPLTTLPKKQDTQYTEPAKVAISITDGEFGWEAGKSILHDMNFIIPRGRLTFVVGPVASGKSTLCKTFLGETKAFKGRVDVQLITGGISFCDQTAFLINASIKENIVGFSDTDDVWYQTVLHAAALEHDITSFPQGDATNVGTDGVNLSGGQRHKVAFARALYARNQIVILDDIFSGLDAGSTEHIFRYALGSDGIARKQGMTVIFATHAIRYLPHADHIIALSANGAIAQEGTYQDLMDQPGYISELRLAHETKKVTDTDQSTEITPIEVVKNQIPLASDNTKEDTARQMGDFSIYLYYFNAAGVMTAIILPCIGIITSIFFNISTIWLKIWTDSTSSDSQTNNAMYLGIYGTFQCLLLISMLILVYHTLITIVTNSGLELHHRVLRTVINAPLAIFSNTDTGVITNRFSQDLNLIDNQLPMGLLNLTFSVFVMFGQAIVIGISSPWTAATYPALILVFYFIQKFYLRTSRQMRFLDLEAKSPLYTHFLETTAGLSTLRAFGWTLPNTETGQSLLDKSQQPSYLLYMIQRWLNFVLDIVITCLAAIITALAVTQGSSSGFAGVALSQLMSLSMSLKSIILMWTDVETSVGAVSRIKSYEEQVPSEHRTEESQVSPSSQWPNRGEIEFRNVTAIYDEAKSDQIALSNMHLHIAPGEKVGLCGRSGSGKSSAILTLFHMLEFSSTNDDDSNNTIMIDDIDIRQVSRNVLRDRLNVLPQHPFFLHGTIRQNLNITDTTKTNSDTDLIQALARVGLTSLATTSTELDNHFNPSSLSHGQRQLFALASAILRQKSQQSKIIILDEVTSNLDHATDKFIQQIIREEFGKCTVIAVAHRLNTIIDFDRVVVMDQGRILEVGNPKELLKRGSERSAFAKMWVHGGGVSTGQGGDDDNVN